MSPLSAQPSLARASDPPPDPGLPPATRRRGLLALIGSTFIALVGQFMVAPWLVFRLDALQTPVQQIGWFSAAIWLGILVTTPFAADLVRHIGQPATLLASLAIPFITLAIIAVTASPMLWALLTVIAGMAIALRWIVAEAGIAELAPQDRRGRIVGLYQTLLGLAFILAPTILAWLGPADRRVPMVALACMGLGLLMTMAVPRPERQHEPDVLSGWRGLRSAALATPALYVAGFLGGFFELGIAALLPVYGMGLGFTAAVAALLISTSGAGSTLTMLPMGEAADRFGAQRMSQACGAINLLACLMLPLAAIWPPAAWPIAFVWGGSGGALYTLSMIELGKRHRGVALINATALLVLSYTVGGLTGPVVTGYALAASIELAVPASFALIAAGGFLLMLKLAR